MYHNGIYLNLRLLGQCADLDCRPRRVRLDKVSRHNLVELGKLTEIRQVNSELCAVRQSTASSLGDRAKIYKYSVGLLLKSIAD